MWHDIEAEVDLLNFDMVAGAAAGLIRSAGGTPLTIGVSGGWGAGKSTLVKLVKANLEASAQKQSDEPSSYILMEFNAWLYQGYEDARQALLEPLIKEERSVIDSRESFFSGDPLQPNKAAYEAFLAEVKRSQKEDFGDA